MICKDRVVIITGAGRGLGRAHALAFAAEGAKVVVNDIGTSGSGEGQSAGPAEQVVAEIEAAGGHALASTHDITDWDEAGDLVHATREQFGGVDVVVNNAGILRDRMFVSASVDEWDAVMRVHLRGHFCLSRHAGAFWRAESKAGRQPDARIINTTSGAGLQGSIGQSAYSAAKGGIAALTLVQAAELDRYGITANAIAPAARTRMTEGPFGEMMKVPDSGFDAWAPENVSPVIVWLGSVHSRAVTGRVFELQGGRISIADGWRPGPAVEQDGRWSPADAGAAVVDLLTEANPPAPVYGSQAMQTPLSKQLGLDAPIFAFTRSKEVVVEVSRKGGMGVLGAINLSPEELDEALDWIDAHIGGKPYGVDTVMPMTYAGKGEDWSEEKLRALISPAHDAFVAKLLQEHGVDELPADYARKGEDLLGWSIERGQQHVAVALRHPIALIANALGTPPPDCIDLAHEHGVKVGALCGKVKQARRHKEAGVDIVIAQGTEAGGHTGEVAGMVLCPEVVDAMGDTPVLMAGGIGSGRQMAAALALGAQGVWTGSIWLTTAEHLAYNAPVVTEKLLAATSTDTVRSRAISGKPARQLRTAWTDAWEGKDSPGFLPIPLMWMVQAEAVERIYHHGNKALAGSPVGQIVGRMNQVVSTAELMDAIITECRATLLRLAHQADPS